MSIFDISTREPTKDEQLALHQLRAMLLLADKTPTVETVYFDPDGPYVTLERGDYHAAELRLMADWLEIRARAPELIEEVPKKEESANAP